MGYYELNQQRKQEIEDGLLALMQEKYFVEITVKDLTGKLHMARKTFYHYFENKWHCLNSLTDRMIWECGLAEIRDLPEDTGMDVRYERNIRFWMDHKEFLDVINRNKMGDFLLHRVMLMMHEEEGLRYKLSTPEVEYDDDILYYYASGQVFLLLKWCEEGFRLPVKQMVKKQMRLTYEPLLAASEKNA